MLFLSSYLNISNVVLAIPLQEGTQVSMDTGTRYQRMQT
jgi:hypothetical protein